MNILTSATYFLRQIPRLVKGSTTENPTATWERIRNDRICEAINRCDGSQEKEPGTIRFVCISDTHNRTKDLNDRIPSGDVLIHAGDFTSVGKVNEVRIFNDFLATLPHQHKVVIAGNHDLSFEPATFDSTYPRLGHGRPDDHRNAKELLTNCIYLEDSAVELFGIKIWGSPWTPWFFDWAFNAERGAECASKWDLIPDDTAVLITHGPPLGYGDLCEDGQRAGCADLLQTVQVRGVIRLAVVVVVGLYGRRGREGGVVV
jgi:hypothetical protein